MQRVRKALEPPGEARDDIADHRRPRRAGWATTGATPTAEEVWNELRVARAECTRGMSYARLEELGGIQWPCSDEDHLEPSFLHGRLWEDPVERAAGAVPRRRARAAGRHARRRSSRCGSRPAGGSTPTTPACRPAATLAAAPRRDARHLARGRRASSASPTATRCASSRAAARVDAPVRIDPALRPGLVFMTLHFPDEVDDQRADDRRHRPEVRHGRVQGDGDPRRAARAGEPRSVGRRRRTLPREPPTDGPASCTTTRPTAPSAPRSTPCSARPSQRGRARREPATRRATSRAAAARRARSGTCCCRRCTRCRRASAGSAAARSNYICQRLDVPPAEAYGVATFYALFSLEPRPPRRRARLRRHRVLRARRRAARRRARAAASGPTGEHAGDGAGDLAAEPVPRPVRAGAGGVLVDRRRRDSRASSSRRPRRRPTCIAERCSRGGDAPPMPRARRVPQAGDAVAAAAAPRRRRRSRRASTATARTAATRRCARRSSWARTA